MDETPQPHQDGEDHLFEQLDRAREFLERRRPAEAMAAAEKARSLAEAHGVEGPVEARVLATLAAAEAGLGQEEQARTHISRAIELNLDSHDLDLVSWYHFAIGLALGQRDFDEAYRLAGPCLTATRNHALLHGDGSIVEWALATSLSLLGDACLALEKLEEARDAYLESLEIRRAIKRDGKPSLESLSPLIRNFYSLGNVWFRLGEHRKAREAQEEGLALAQGIRHILEETPAVLREVALGHEILGDGYDHADRLELAYDAYRRSVLVRRRIIEFYGATEDDLEHLFRAEDLYGHVALRSGRRKLAHEAVERMEKVLEERESSYGAKRSLLEDRSKALKRRLQIHWMRGEIDEATEACERDVALRAEIDREYGDDAQGLENTAWTHESLSDVQLARGETREAIRSAERALELRRRAHEAEPDAIEHRRPLCSSLASLARLQRSHGDEAEARRLEDGLFALCRAIIESPLASPRDLQWFHDTLIEIFARENDGGDLDALRRCVSLLDELQAAGDRLGFQMDGHSLQMSELYLALSEVERQQGEFDAAEENAERALRHIETSFSGNDTTAQRHRFLARVHFLSAQIASAKGNFEHLLSAAETSVLHSRLFLAQEPESDEGRRALTESLFAQALGYRAQGRKREAQGAAKEAMAHSLALAPENRDEPALVAMRRQISRQLPLRARLAHWLRGS